MCRLLRHAAAGAQGRAQTARLWHVTDDDGAKEMLKFNLARRLAGAGRADAGRPVNGW